MNQQTALPAAPAEPFTRRTDAGMVRLGERDVAGLLLCGDMYGAPYDLLADALDVRADRLRGIVARWRRAGYCTTARLGPGPAWCWLTRSGLAVTGLGYAPLAAALLSGDTVQGTWDQVKWPMTAALASRYLASGPLSEGAADLDLTRSWTVDLGDGRRYELQPVLAHLNSVRVSAWPETDGVADDAPVAVVLEPADEEHALSLRLSRATAHAGARADRVMMEDDPLTLVSADVFEDLVSTLEEPAEPAPALAKAAAWLRAIRT